MLRNFHEKPFNSVATNAKSWIRRRATAAKRICVSPAVKSYLHWSKPVRNKTRLIIDEMVLSLYQSETLSPIHLKESEKCSTREYIGVRSFCKTYNLFAPRRIKFSANVSNRQWPTRFRGELCLHRQLYARSVSELSSSSLSLSLEIERSISRETNIDVN